MQCKLQAVPRAPWPEEKEKGQPARVALLVAWAQRSSHMLLGEREDLLAGPTRGNNGYNIVLGSQAPTYKNFLF